MNFIRINWHNQFKRCTHIHKKKIHEVCMKIANIVEKYIHRYRGLFLLSAKVTYLHTPMNVGNPHTPWSHKENILLFIFTSLEFIMLIWANFIRFMLILISLFHQIEELLQSQRRCWLLTCVNYLGFFQKSVRKLESFLCPSHEDKFENIALGP